MKRSLAIACACVFITCNMFGAQPFARGIVAKVIEKNERFEAWFDRTTEARAWTACAALIAGIGCATAETYVRERNKWAIIRKSQGYTVSQNDWTISPGQIGAYGSIGVVFLCWRPRTTTLCGAAYGAQLLWTEHQHQAMRRRQREADCALPCPYDLGIRCERVDGRVICGDATKLKVSRRSEL